MGFGAGRTVGTRGGHRQPLLRLGRLLHGAAHGTVAAQGGLITAQGAAAVIIGANIGTTATALLAAIGATPNARRVAAAHVIFNVLTACVALALLPWLIGALATARAALGLAPDAAAKLALFHTTFNLLGVLLMWPLADVLTLSLIHI